MLKDMDHLLEQHLIYAQAFNVAAIEELHQDVSKYELPTGVSEGVQRGFDAARHAYIYSYFSYDLLMPGVGQLFACLELALRQCLGLSWDGKSGPTLFKMLAAASEKNLIKSDVGGLHKMRNIFQHGTEAIIDPNFFLNVLAQVTLLMREMYAPEPII